MVVSQSHRHCFPNFFSVNTRSLQISVVLSNSQRRDTMILGFSCIYTGARNRPIKMHFLVSGLRLHHLHQLQHSIKMLRVTRPRVLSPAFSIFQRSLATHTALPQTYVEKVVQKHAVGLPEGKIVRAGDYVMIRPEHVMTHVSSRRDFRKGENLLTKELRFRTTQDPLFPSA